MTDAEIDALAREIILEVVAACISDEEWINAIKAQPIVIIETGNHAFHYSQSTDFGQITADLDPLPFAIMLIKLFEGGNVPLNNTTLAFIILEMLRRWPMLIVSGTFEAAYGGMGHFQSHQSRKRVQSEIRKQQQIFFGFDVGNKKGNRRNLSPSGEKIAFQTIADTIPIFSNIQRELTELRSQWEAKAPNRRAGKDELWRDHLKRVIAPQNYSQYDVEVITTLFHRDPRKRNPTYAACTHLAPFFGSTPATLYRKYGERQSK